MLTTAQLSEMFEFVVAFLGLLLLLKKVAEMDRYHMVRVVAMTVILSVAGIWVLDKVGTEASFWGRSDCVIDFNEHADHW